MSESSTVYQSFGAEYDVMCGSCGDYEAVVNCDNPSCQMQLCSSCRRQHKKGNHWITIIDEENDVAFEGCDGCHREVGYVWDNTPIGKTEAGIPMQRGGWIRDAESFGAESQIGPTDECKVFLYEAYRDTIHTFNGCFETLDEAETYIYNTWMQDAKATLKELRTKKEQGRMGISDWMQTIIDDKEKMLGYMSVEAYEDMLAEQVKNRPERAKQDEEGLKYYEDNMDRWEKEWKILSQTPQATIQESNSKLYPAYSQRYQNGSGNYPYIIFDPSFIPDTQGAESFGAEEPVEWDELIGEQCQNCKEGPMYEIVKVVEYDWGVEEHYADKCKSCGYQTIWNAESFGAEGHGPYAGNYRAHVMEYLLGETSDDEIMDVFDISQEDLDTYWEAESFGAEYGKRQRFGNRYVGRDTKGKFISNVSVGRSLRADRRNKSKTPARSGFGNMGDIQKGVSGFTLPSDTKRMIGMGAVLGGILAYWESKA